MGMEVGDVFEDRGNDRPRFVARESLGRASESIIAE